MILTCFWSFHALLFVMVFRPFFAKSSAMSSMPPENLLDALQPLDRWTLDTVQFSNRRFLELTTNGMPNVSLRQVESADFRADDGSSYWRVSIHPSGIPALRESWNGHGDFNDFFLTFLNALRSSRVACLVLTGRFSPVE